MAGYAKDVLVETDWLAEHVKDPNVRLFEVDVDPRGRDTRSCAVVVGTASHRYLGSSMRITWPVRSWPSALSKYATVCATLPGAHGLSTSSATALTVMSRPRSSSASTRMSASVAALAAASAP